MIRPKTGRGALLSVLAITTLVATACSSSGSSSTSAGSSGSAAGASTTALKGTPIVIANVTSRTGAIAQHTFEGVDAWVKYTNANGGIDGHPVVLHGVDSQSSATAETEGFQTLASQDKPAAFVGVGTFDMAGDVQVINQLKIPVIGGQIGEVTWNASPYLYPPGLSYVPGEFALAAAAPAGAKKLGQVYCEEAPGCATQNTILQNPAIEKAAGTTLVFTRKISLSAPNYTAMCLAAKQAGVQSLIVGTNDLALIRIATDCAAQGFNPTYLYSGILGTNATLSVPGLQNSIGIMTNFSIGDTSATTEAFRTAMAKYEPPVALDALAVQGWVGAVLFGEAAKKVLSAGGQVTSTSIGTALDSINDNLGGLDPASVKFVAGQPAPLTYCWVNQTIKNDKFVEPDGLTPQCAPSSIRPLIDSLQTTLSQ